VSLNNNKSAEELSKEKDDQCLGDFSVTKVPKQKPLTRAQFEVAKQHWPLYFHEDKRFVQAMELSEHNSQMLLFSSLEKMLKSEFFSDDELVSITSFMKLTTVEACEVG